MLWLWDLGLHFCSSVSHVCHVKLSCVQLFATLWTVWPTRLLCPWDSPGKDTGVGSHSLLQGIFLIQGSNSALLCLPALAVGFFTTSATWEACFLNGMLSNSRHRCPTLLNQDVFPSSPSHQKKHPSLLLFALVSADDKPLFLLPPALLHFYPNASTFLCRTSSFLSIL